MTWLCDTDVISETGRDVPDPSVLRFVASLDRLRASAVTYFEIASGIARLREGRRRRFLTAWLAALDAGVLDVVALDRAVARVASELDAAARSTGRPIELRDLLILATARTHGLGVATRNVAHFRGRGVRIHDPFTGTEHA